MHDGSRYAIRNHNMYVFDLVDLASERQYSDEGFLNVPARISRTGVQQYRAVELGLEDREPDAVINIYRPEDEVFSKGSLASFANKPVTNNHPPESVSPANAKEFAVGMSGPDVVRDAGFVKATLCITDQNAIEGVESGKVELSNGYSCDFDWTPGVTDNGEKYEGVQRNIRGNHIAIVTRGRAGPSCRLADNKSKKEGNDMPKINIDGVEFEVSDQAAQAVGKLTTRLADAEKNLGDITKKLKDSEKSAKKAADEAKAKLDDAESKLPNAEQLDTLVADRTALVVTCRKLVSDIKWEGKDNDTLRKEIVAAKCPDAKLDDVSVDYINARFDAIVEAHVADGDNDSKGGSNKLNDALASQVKKTEDSDADNRPAHIIAREKFMADTKEAWKVKGKETE